MSRPVTVRVQTSETNRQENFGVNPSTQYHNVTIEAWKGHAEFTVYPYVDGVAEPGADQLIADILSISQVDGATRYTEGATQQHLRRDRRPAQRQRPRHSGRQPRPRSSREEARPSPSPAPGETRPNP